MFDTDRYIMSKVQEHYDYAKSLGYTVLGVFAYGSMNYGYFIEGQSDVDTKVIIIPKPRDVVFGKPVSKEYTLPDKSHMEVKDIREMLTMYLKGNINFVETLFTNYKILNPEFELRFTRDFLARRDDITKYNPYHTAMSVLGQARHTLKQFLNETEKDPKKLHNVARLNDFLIGYISGDAYERCLVETNAVIKETIFNLKLNLPNDWEEWVETFTNSLNKREQESADLLLLKEVNTGLKLQLEFDILTLLNNYWRYYS